MARTQSRLQLALAARRMADHENSQFVADAEVNVWIDQRLAQLYDLLVGLDSDRYVVEDTVTTTSSADPPWTVLLPENFYILRGVDLVRGRQRIPLQQYALQERLVDGSDGGWPYVDCTALRYRVASNALDGSEAALHFDRNPGNSTLVVYYVPNPPRLEEDSSEIDGFAGWEEWIVRKVAIDILNKEESDTSALERQCAELEQRIKRMAAMRDTGAAYRVADVRNYGYGCGYRWPRAT
jgi:hypothetical protein